MKAFGLARTILAAIAASVFSRSSGAAIHDVPLHVKPRDYAPVMPRDTKVAIQWHPISYTPRNQRKVRKNRRRRWAAGNLKAFT